jgi:hypothetical protein
MLAEDKKIPFRFSTPIKRRGYGEYAAYYLKVEINDSWIYYPPRGLKWQKFH